MLYYCSSLKDGETLKIIYHCYGGTHSSVTAAALHLGWLPSDRLPTIEKLLQTPYFDTRTSKEFGYITFMGTDERGNEIYVVGRNSMPQVLANLIDGLAAIFNIPKDTFRLINVMPKVNFSMRIGGVLSRRFKLVNLGRPLVAWGTIKAFPYIQELIKSTKDNLETNQ